MATWPKEEDIVRAISNGGIKFKEQEQSLSISRVRQFGLYPMWTQGNVRESAPSTRGPEWTHRWCTSCLTNRHRWVAKCGLDKR